MKFQNLNWYFGGSGESALLVGGVFFFYKHGKQVRDFTLLTAQNKAICKVPLFQGFPLYVFSQMYQPNLYQRIMTEGVQNGFQLFCFNASISSYVFVPTKVKASTPNK